MKKMKLPLYTSAILALNLLLSGCSSDSESALIPAANLFPQPSAFGEGCTVDSNMSDKVAMEILGGTYKEPEAGRERPMPYTQCQYKNPNVNVSISRFLTVEHCDKDYKKGYETFTKTNEAQPLEGYGVEGYKYEMGPSPGCCFKYGNVAVLLWLYKKEDEEKIIKTLIQHFESIKS